MDESRIVAFDLETTDLAPGAGLPEHVTVAAVRMPAGEVRHWHGDVAAAPGCTLGPEACRALVRELTALVEGGLALVTWNGAAFDLQLLARESGLARECALLAARHYDLMFQFLCLEGFPVSLAAVAAPLGLGKAAGLAGADAPRAWREGQHERVMEYLAGDVTLTARVAAAAVRARRLRGIPRQGKPRSCAVDRLLTVEECLRLPLPDTSWMRDPPQRAGYTGWIERALAAAPAAP